MIKLSFLILIVGIACNTPVENKTEVPPLYVGTGKLIPINFADSNYADVINYAVDTITPSGWQITYLVKDDSTRYSDIYIEWSNEKTKGIYKAEDALEIRRYFIPKYMGETHNHILFEHGCATDCSAILVCEEDTSPQARDIIYVIAYDFTLGQLAYLTEDSYDTEENVNVGVLNLLYGKEYKALFKGISPYANKQFAVDTVMFSQKQVSITASLRNTYADTVFTQKQKVIYY
jgi:hypothetical protein